MKFLFTTQASNDLGLLIRSLPIASELKKRGHEVVFCNPAKTPRLAIAEAGFENLIPRHPAYYLNHLLVTNEPDLQSVVRLIFSKRIRKEFGGVFGFLYQLDQTRPQLGSATNEIYSVDHLAALSGMLSENFVRSECAALIQLMTEFEADVVIDALHPVACMAARILRKPLVTFIQADMHPDSKGFIWWKEPLPNLPTPTPILNKILAEYGLSPIRKTEDLLVGDLTLVLGMPETDPLPPETEATYIGAILWQKAGIEPPEWLSRLDRAKPVVWVYSGNPRYLPIITPIDSSIVIRSCIAALAREDVQVILTTGYHNLPREFHSLPLNFRHQPFVPGLMVAQRSDLMIHHGGYGSCQTGLYTGTPAVIIPTYSERESNARRVKAVSAGEFIAPRTDPSGRKKYIDSHELREMVMHVLSTPAYAGNAKRISEKLQSFGGISWTVGKIEEFCRSWQGCPSAEPLPYRTEARLPP
jgi:UDP:flavonoid glycosyltransferase YjiC (YdhE family)